MKVLLIGFFTRTYMPYIDKYETCLKEKGIEYDITFFDRDSTNKAIQHNNNEYTYCHTTTTSRLQKLLPVFCYIRFVRKLIKRNKYEKLIVMTTMPAVLLRRLLLGEYIGKYIFDYRDTTYEHYGVFRGIVNRLIDGSAFTAMSSRGYLNVLSESNKILINHNISNEDDVKHTVKDIREEHPVIIGFLGYVRYFDVNSLLIKQLCNNTSFKLQYIGTPFSDCDLATYAESIEATNVEVIGKYDNRNKAKLYENISIINSMYSLNSSEVQYAIPNRVYDAALFKIPIMTTAGTYLSEVVAKYGLGFSINPFSDDIAQLISEYIESFHKESFYTACNTFLAIVQRDEHTLRERIMHFLDGEI